LVSLNVPIADPGVNGITRRKLSPELAIRIDRIEIVVIADGRELKLTGRELA
jgi:hypothetical protein